MLSSDQTLTPAHPTAGPRTPRSGLHTRDPRRRCFTGVGDLVYAGGMSKVKRHGLIDVSLYGARVQVCTTRKRWGKVSSEITDALPVPVGVDGFTFASDDCSGCYVVYVDPSLSDVALVDTCAHEAAHLADFILGACGHRITLGEADEPYAYLVGWLTGRLYAIVAGVQ